MDNDFKEESEITCKVFISEKSTVKPLNGKEEIAVSEILQVTQKREECQKLFAIFYTALPC